MKSSKGIREQLNRAKELTEKFSMFKQDWVNGENGYILYNPTTNERIMLDEYDADLLLKALSVIQAKLQYEIDHGMEWCRVNVHINLADMKEKDKKHRKKKAKDRALEVRGK